MASKRRKNEDGSDMSGEERLLRWEAVSVALAIHFQLPIGTGITRDFFQCLALPGMKDPTMGDQESLMRHGMFKVLRRVALGRAKPLDSNLMKMLEAAYDGSVSAQPSGYRDFVMGWSMCHYVCSEVKNVNH